MKLNIPGASLAIIEGDKNEKQARALATFKPNRPVGSMFEYSNMNYRPSENPRRPKPSLGGSATSKKV